MCRPRRGPLSGGRAPGVCRQRLDLLHAELATDKYGEARRLSGLIHASSGHREYYVTCQLFADNGTPISLPTQTKHTSFAKRVTWQEWVTLPIAYRDLPADAVRTPNPPARSCANIARSGALMLCRWRRSRCGTWSGRGR